MQLLHCLLSSITRNGETYRRRQLFSSTCHIHTRIRNEICMREKKFYEKAVLSERTQFLYRFKTVIYDTRNPRNYATTHVAFRTESIPTTTFLARCLQLNTYNTYMRIYYVNANVQFHADITSISHRGSGSVRKANRAYHFPAGKCRLHSSAHR